MSLECIIICNGMKSALVEAKDSCDASPRERVVYRRSECIDLVPTPEHRDKLEVRVYETRRPRIVPSWI